MVVCLSNTVQDAAKATAALKFSSLAITRERRTTTQAFTGALVSLVACLMMLPVLLKLKTKPLLMHWRDSV